MMRAGVLGRWVSGGRRWLTTVSGGRQDRVALIGAGQIGTAVGLGLLRGGHSVRVHDPAWTNRSTLEDAGATWCEQVEDTLDGSAGHDVVITALPAPPHVRAVMEEDGVLHGMRPGSTWIDHTTTDPEEAKRLAGVAAQLDVEMLEAPLTGGYQLLCAGLMTVLVGGDAELLARHEDLMRSYVATVLRMGDVGAASIVKLITNQLAAVHLVAAGEAVMMAKQSNIDLNAFFDGVRASAGNSYVFETEVPLMFNNSFDPGFFISLHCKDLRIAREVHTGAATNVAPEAYNDVYKVHGVTEGIYEEAMQRYGGSAGSSAPAKMLQDELEASMACAGFSEWEYEIEKVRSGSIGVVHKNVGRDASGK